MHPTDSDPSKTHMNYIKFNKNLHLRLLRLYDLILENFILSVACVCVRVCEFCVLTRGCVLTLFAF